MPLDPNFRAPTEPRVFTFWFHHNVAFITLTATSRDEAWQKLIDAISTPIETPQGLINLNGGATLTLGDINDESWWEPDADDEAREGVMVIPAIVI